MICTPGKYLGGQIKEDKMCGACGTYGGRDCIPGRKRPF
jgi:hypothetical protein